MKNFSDRNFGQRSNDESSEVDLIGFDKLWNANYQETYEFIRLQSAANNDKVQTEIELITTELDDKNFEIQKLNWQLSEREKELQNLYDELHKLIELNKKLNKQLGDFERLTAKQEHLINMLSGDKDALAEPELPNFGR